MTCQATLLCKLLSCKEDNVQLTDAFQFILFPVKIHKSRVTVIQLTLQALQVNYYKLLNYIQKTVMTTYHKFCRKMVNLQCAHVNVL